MKLALSISALAMILALVVLGCTREVVKEVEVPGETVIKEVVKVETVEVPGETVIKEVVKVETVEVPGETVVKRGRQGGRNREAHRGGQDRDQRNHH